MKYASFFLVLVFVSTSSAASLLEKKREVIAVQKLSYLHNRDVQKMVRARLLVSLKSTKYVEVNQKLDARERLVRPWMPPMLNKFAAAYYRKWGEPIRVNSALRTIERHSWLRMFNSNAAQGYSPHSTGATVDISHKGFSREKIRWVKEWWKPYTTNGQAVLTTEWFQACFDIFIARPKPAAAKPQQKSKKNARSPH